MIRGSSFSSPGATATSVHNAEKSRPGQPAQPARGIQDSQVTVGDSRPLPLPEDAMRNRRWLLIQNLDAVAAIWLGGPSVTPGTGTKIAAGDAFEWPVRNAELYAIADAGASCDVRILELG